MKSVKLLDAYRVSLMLSIQQKNSWGKNELMTLVDRKCLDIMKCTTKEVEDITFGTPPDCDLVDTV